MRCCLGGNCRPKEIVTAHLASVLASQTSDRKEGVATPRHDYDGCIPTLMLRT
jgi:hypothetical protein